jgi:hypothetical protein
MSHPVHMPHAIRGVPIAGDAIPPSLSRSYGPIPLPIGEPRGHPWHMSNGALRPFKDITSSHTHFIRRRDGTVCTITT